MAASAELVLLESEAPKPMKSARPQQQQASGRSQQRNSLKMQEDNRNERAARRPESPMNNKPPASTQTSHLPVGDPIKWPTNQLADHSSAHRQTKPITTTTTTTTKTTSGKSNANATSSIILSTLLPLLFVLLLPTINYDYNAAYTSTDRQATSLTDRPTLGQQMSGEFVAYRDEQAANRWPHLASLCDFLQQLVRFPLDRFRLGSGLVSLSQAKEIASKHDLQEEEQQQSNMMLLSPAEHRAAYLAPQPAGHGGGGYGPGDQLEGPPPPLEPGAGDLGGEFGNSGQGGEVGVGSASGQALQTRAELPAVRALNVKCEKNHMTVNIVFDRPFYGLVFSKGHYNDQKCVHLPANSGQTSVNFDIHLGKCGMSSSDASGHSTGLQREQQQHHGNQQQPNGLYIENTIIIQYDPQVQEIYDQARKLRCTWYDYYEKSVTFRPYNVDMLDAVTANFLGDNIQCWMQIQVGKGPWEHEVAGIVKIGQTMTMVLAIKDDENKFDMLVRNCVAHDGKHEPIKLVDEYGCVARPKIMAKFQKIRKFASPAATVVSYAHFQAFKFPDSMSVHFQCVIQVCRYECPEPVCGNQPPGGPIGELAGPNGPHGGNSNGDYAASGTEIVASKEPVPSYALPPPGPFNESHAGHSSHALKLDESQGRVQVKLDTSMMAGLSGGPRPYNQRAASASASAQGPLPPHLLHMAPPASGSAHRVSTQASTSTSSGHAFLTSAPYYRPATQNGRSQPVAGHRVGTLLASGSNQVGAQQQQLAPPLGYSPAYPPTTQAASQTPRVSQYLGATNRLGELAPPSGAAEMAAKSDDQLDNNNNNNHQVSNMNHLAAGNPLSLIALPRGLRMAPATISLTAASSTLKPPANHRFRREVERTAGNESAGRQQRATGESTAIKTHKTIQVVSPDDVAFSLIADELTPVEQTFGAGGQSDRWMARQHQRQSLQQQQQQQQVCFSAARLMLVVLVTLGTLAAGIVIAAYVILKQRSRLEQKLSTVYEIHDHLDGGASLGANQQAAANLLRQQQQQEAELIARRQRAELHQRHSYLARLYSQFAPVTHWQR